MPAQDAIAGDVPEPTCPVHPGRHNPFSVVGEEGSRDLVVVAAELGHGHVRVRLPDSCGPIAARGHDQPVGTELGVGEELGPDGRRRARSARGSGAKSRAARKSSIARGRRAGTNRDRRFPGVAPRPSARSSCRADPTVRGRGARWRGARGLGRGHTRHREPACVDGTQVRTLLVVLDQFEEYFLYHSDEDGDGSFARELPRIINAPALRARP